MEPHGGAPWGTEGHGAPWGAQGHGPQGPMGFKDPGVKDPGGPRGAPWKFFIAFCICCDENIRHGKVTSHLDIDSGI